MNIEKIIREALQDCGETLTDSGIQCVATWIEGCIENRSLMDGPVSSPYLSEIEDLKRKHKEEIERLNKREKIFINSVASRRNVHTSQVYIDGNSVMISER